MSTRAGTRWLYVDTQKELEAACHLLARADVLCVDTEFHRESTYYAEFALIQVASDEHCFLVDPLALDDLAPLWELLHDAAITKVFHAARQDAEIILHESGALPLPLFDTQIAASLLGYGLQTGFGNLVQRITGHALPKGESFTDWMRRPLTPKQLAYAADDVIWLMPVYRHLLKELRAHGRLDWLAEEQQTLCSPDTYSNDVDSIFWRVKGANRLKPRQLAVLRELAAWREREARRRNLPRRRIIGDEPLLSLARKTELSAAQLAGIRGLNNGIAKRFGDGILKAWRAGMSCPESDWPRPERAPANSAGTDMRQELLSALVRLRAEEVRIASSILASKQDIVALASWANQGGRNGAEPPDNPCLHGWRRELVGEDMLRMLKGELCLRLDPKTNRPVIAPVNEERTGDSGPS